MQTGRKCASLRLGGIAALLLCFAAACPAQDLGEVARQQRLKKGAAAASERRVLTNEDIHSSASPAAASPPQKEVASRTDSAAQTSTSTPEAKKDSKPSAEEVRATIRMQKGVVSRLEGEAKEVQARLDSWKGRDCRQWVHKDYSSACDIPPELLSEKGRLDAELAQERKTLEEMQEAARRMGYGNSVYEPD